MPVYIQVIGYLASILIPLAFLPQTIKIITTRQTKGISIPAYIIYFIGIIAFLVFAIFKTPIDIPMIVCQTINGLFAITIISLTCYNFVTKKTNNANNSLTQLQTWTKTLILPITLLLCCAILLAIGFALKDNSLTIYNNIMGYVGAVLISIAFLPQTYKLFKTKNTKGLSLTTTLIYHLGLTLFIIYASLSSPINYPLLLGNVFGWIVNICLIFLICYNLYHQKNLTKSKKKEIKNGVTNATH